MVRKPIFLIVLWSLLLGISCSSASPSPMPTATVQPTATFTAVSAPTPAFQPDMAIFEIVWQTVRDGFYDPNMNGVDWQAMHDLYKPQVAAATDELSYYLLLNDMLFELGVSHIAILPSWAADELDPITFPAGSLGFDARLLGEQMVVTRVQPDSPAAAHGLQPGYVIDTINGLTPVELAQERLQTPPFNERNQRAIITQAVRAELYGAPGKQVTISYLNGDDEIGEVTLTYAPRPGKLTTLLPNLPPAFIEFEAYRVTTEIGYMRFSGFLPGVDVDVAAAIDEMADTRAAIRAAFFLCAKQWQKN
jgi:C-terminal processing protease CtpA/Prc